MIFLLRTTDRQGESREFSLQGELESGFMLLDHIAQKGQTLTRAMVLDGSRFSELPIEYFGEQDCLPALKALESEWKQILSKPVNIRLVCIQRLPTLISRRIERHKICITQLEQAVDIAEQRLQRVFTTIHAEPHRSRMLYQLEAALKRHQQNLSTERVCLRKYLDQIPH